MLASDSATAVLQQVCGGAVLACRLSPDAVDGDPACAELLQAGAGQAVTRRHVRLTHGPLELSQAQLWYVAARLPEDMAHALSTTALPFGRVVSGLRLRRATLSARICDPGEPCALDHRALLAGADGRPIALVHERYGWALFAPG